MTNYSAPLDRLLTLGDPDESGVWLDYATLGVNAAHIPELIRLAGDPDFDDLAAENPAVWAPLHAWRALGQLRAVEAIEPLLDLLERQTARDDDYAALDLPRVFGMIGPAVLPALERMLFDHGKGSRLRVLLAETLELIGVDHPEARSECVRILIAQLASSGRDDADVNGWVVSALLELKATEAIPILEQAFKEQKVDETIAGDWEWCRYELGLRPDRPEKTYSAAPWDLGDLQPTASPSRSHAATPMERAQARRKEAKKAKKHKRKKK